MHLRSRRGLGALLALAVVVALAAVTAGTLSRAAHAAAVVPAGVDPTEVAPNQEINRDVPGSRSAAHVPSSHVPRPASQNVTSVNPGATGFQGLDHFDQRTADSGHQFSLEPPDQGLCVGGGETIEAVNDVFATYASGARTSPGATSLTKFYTGKSQIIRATATTPVVFGPFISDPKCYFDPQLNQYFMTALQIDRNPATGVFTGGTSVYIAVSMNATPTTSSSDWFIYNIDTTNDGRNGTPTHAGCPCLGDQPLIGADAYGFYVTTNEFPLFANGFNGAQVYAFDKAGLANGTLKFQLIDGTPIPLAEGPAYSIQPATSPTRLDWSNEANGTEYLLSALDFDATLDNRIAVWSLTNTQSLTTATPNVKLSNTLVSSETYGQPPDAAQQDGPYPLGQSLKEHEELLAGNDDRMNQAIYQGGQLWGALNTVVKTDNGPTHIGNAYFVTHPSATSSGVSATLVGQGYVAVNQQNVMFPSVAVNSAGKALVAFTLVGSGYYPSAGYASITATGATGDVHVTGAGVGPNDGFTGYHAFGGSGTARWGDYGAAVASGGSIYMASEYVGQSCTLAQYTADTTCGRTRTSLANWSTFISTVTP